AEAHPARAGGGGADHPELRLAGQRAEPVVGALFGVLELQHEAGDLRCAHVEHGDDPPLQRRAPHVPHRPLGLVEIGHGPDTLVSLTASPVAGAASRIVGRISLRRSTTVRSRPSMSSAWSSAMTRWTAVTGSV